MTTLSLLPSSSSYLNISFIALALALIVSAFFIFLRKKKPGRVNLPPGPPGWPIVGNLFQVAGSGKQFFQFVRDLLPIYGPIFTLKMGTRTLIIISSPELAHEALIQMGPVFANRPAELVTRTIFSSNMFTVNSAVHGPVWRSLRRNMVQGMLSTTRVKDFRGVRCNAMDRLVDLIRTEEETADGAVWVLKNVRFAVFCILLSMCFGVEMDEKAIQLIDRTMKAVVVTLLPRLDDFLPILGPLFTKQRKRAIEVREHQLRTLTPFIEKRRSALHNLGSNKIGSDFAYLDTLFDLKIEGRNSCPTNPELVTLCSEFLNGGTDTTATAVEWGIARLIQNPEIQSKLYTEIKSTIGNRNVDEKDVDGMPYLNAFTKELLRKHPPTYFALTHAVTQPAKLAGYDIPTGVNVEFFTPAIAHDPKIWSKPEEFNPDRFLSGNEDADITGAREMKMMPFGAGRRICPGLGMGMLHINLIMARMVQEFEWGTLPSKGKIDFSEKLEFTVVMMNPLQALAKPRAKK